MAITTTDRVPVTVLTGFLGSGKTTLLNHMLTANHGKRIAVIENEFGEVGVDQELVINAEEEIFEMNNGCICCTVRGDLIRILGSLMKRKDKFDAIVIETTGMADPGPVAQTFYVDDEMKEKLNLDGVVTVVDARHVWQHFETDEVQEQIAFADVILLNKTDLVTGEELDQLEARLHKMNSAARIYRTRNSLIDMDRVLNLGGFDLQRALETDPKFLEPEYPFEWGGIYQLSAGRYQWVMQPGPDPAMNLTLLPTNRSDNAGLEAVLMDAVLTFSDEEVCVGAGEVIRPGKSLSQLQLAEGESCFEFEIPVAGSYALFTEHHPDEFAAKLLRGTEGLVPLVTREYKPDHDHDDEISSVGITTPGDLDSEKFNGWLRELLTTKGQDIFRMKGVLSVKGDERRFVFQGVHMLFDGNPDRSWQPGERHNSLIFIGRNLDREELNKGFMACLV
ncbi:MAG: GTP-binding protein [Planctomycetes bacterium]|nr:GTP-binding protein [Planctomycetota bacterium]